jgi:hypothetical protein
MTTLERMTKKEKKEYFTPYIVRLLIEGVKPSYHSHDTGQSIDHYYILGNLVDGRFAIYASGEITITNGIDDYGNISYEGVSYSAQSFKKFLRLNINLTERDLVLRARYLIKQYKGTYQKPY